MAFLSLHVQPLICPSNHLDGARLGSIRACGRTLQAQLPRLLGVGVGARVHQDSLKSDGGEEPGGR